MNRRAQSLEIRACADPHRYEPHYREINNAQQVEIFEPILKDSQGNVTTGLLSAVGYLKDNRLLPSSFDKRTAESDIAVVGDALGDPGFTDKGSVIRHVVDTGRAAAPFHAQVELWYQPIGFRWAHNLQPYNAVEPQRFVRYYESESSARPWFWRARTRAISFQTRHIVARSSNNTSADVELIVAQPEDERVLANLLELYIHEFTEWIDLDVGPDGRFGYGQLPLYWSEPDRYPFLLKVDGRLAGFVLIRRGKSVYDDNEVWDVAEFFILKRYRRRGIGTHATRKVWQRFPGRWEIRVMQENAPARRFWANAVTEYCGQTIRPVRMKKDAQWWQVFTFNP